MLGARDLMCLPSSYSSNTLAPPNEKYGAYTRVSAEALLEHVTSGTTADKMIDLRAGQRVQVFSSEWDKPTVDADEHVCAMADFLANSRDRESSAALT